MRSKMELAVARIVQNFARRLRAGPVIYFCFSSTLHVQAVGASSLLVSSITFHVPSASFFQMVM
jgi:hypothetical protein